MSAHNEEFDRSKCFTFFESYYTTGKMIEEMKGKDIAYEYYKAIIEYALYKKPIENKEILLYAGGDTALRVIDSSQERRARGFGENTERTQAIIEFVRDHPGVSQNEVAAQVHCSKGKVNQALKNFREGKYVDTFDFNIIINGKEYRSDGQVVTDQSESEYEVIDDGTEDSTALVPGTYIHTDTDNDIDNDSTDRYRYRDADSRIAGSVTESRCAPEVADAPIANAQKDPEREKKREENLNYFRSLDYGGIMSNDLIPEVCEVQYAREEYENETIEERRERLMKFLTGGFVRAKKELAEELVDTVIAGNGRL